MIEMPFKGFSFAIGMRQSAYHLDAMEPIGPESQEQAHSPALTAYLRTRNGNRELDEQSVIQDAHDGVGVAWVNVRIRDGDQDAGAIANLLKIDIDLAREFLRQDWSFGFRQVGDSAALGFHYFEGDPRKPIERRAFCYFQRGALFVILREESPLIDDSYRDWCRQASAKVRSSALALDFLIDDVIQAYFPLIDAMEDLIDELEARIYSGEGVNSIEAFQIKHRLMDVRRSLTPIREIISAVLRRGLTFVPDADRVFFQDTSDHIMRLLEMVDLNRDVLASVMDANLNIVSNSINMVMKRMTAIATVLMSISFIAGVYGMNFANMPELEWPLGYGFALGLMAVIAITEVALFRKYRWL